MKKGKLLLLGAILVAGCSPAATSIDEPPVTVEPQAEPTRPTMEATEVAPTLALPEETRSPELSQENEAMPSEAESDVEVPAGAESLVAQAKEMIVGISQSGITAGEIRVASIEEMQWRDSSMGCPQEGMMYLQVITPGYLIRLQAEGKVYDFHTNRADRLVLCKIDGKSPTE